MPIDKTKLTKEMLDNVAGGCESGCHHMPMNKQCDHTYGTLNAFHYCPGIPDPSIYGSK